MPVEAHLTYARALAVLAKRQEAHVSLGLDRVRRVLAALGDPQDAGPSVHVAGTNGKGSVCALLESVLREAGLRTGLYTSPHLADPRERIQVGGRPIQPAALARALERVLAVEAEPLTFFELMTAAAFVHFREARVEVAVLETGLGGRLDATNLVRRPLACLVPTVDLDHTGWLGASLASIAREKAGIFKRGAPAFTGETKPAALRALRAGAARRGAPWTALGARPAWRSLKTEWGHGRQRLRGPGGRRFTLGLLGAGQVRNAALVYESLEALRAGGLRIPESAVARGFARVRWPGRFEVLRRGEGWVILDGAHNPQAMGEFCRTLAASPWARAPKLFVVGVLKDKDFRALARQLAPMLHQAIATEPPSPRALEAGKLAEELLAAAPGARITALRKPSEALETCLRAGAPVACVVGSFYLVGAARRMLGAR